MSVQAIRPQLTEQDIHRLMKGDTPEQRASVAHRLCRRIALDVLSEDERKYAEEIMAILADDAADLVRRTLSVTLRNSPILPREIALKLAQDIEAVAIPVLQDSPVFTEEDLIELVLSVTAAKQAAIAARDNISVTLTEVISEHGQVEAVRALSSNTHAEFTDRAYDDTLRRFHAACSTVAFSLLPCLFFQSGRRTRRLGGPGRAREAMVSPQAAGAGHCRATEQGS